MIAIVITIAMTLFAIAALLNLYRLAVGPDIVDRILALDTLMINSIARIEH